MSLDNKTAACGEPLFRRTGVKGQTVPGFGGKVTYGGAYEAAGEFTHSDRASGYDNLTAVVSGIMTVLDCVGVTFVVIAACMVAFVVGTFSLALVGSSGASVGLYYLTGLVIELMATGIRRIASVFGIFEMAFVARPFTLVNFLPLVASRIISVAISETAAPKSTRLLNVWVKVALVVTLLTTAFWLGSGSKLAPLALSLQVFLLTLADVGIFRDASAVYMAAVSTLFLHPLAVVLFASLGYRLGWAELASGRFRDGSGGRAGSSYGFSCGRGSLGRRRASFTSKQQRMDKSSRDFLKKLASTTGLHVPRMYEYASVQQWQSFGAVGVPSELDKCLRGLALYGDREMASVVARVGLREAWDVQRCSDVSQRLLTNAAFTKYFDVKLSQLFPQMRFSTEKKKGTLVEALVGAAALEPGSYAAVERFVLVDVRGVVGE